MNCFEFRRVCMAEPQSRAADYRSHRATCPRCHAFAAREDEFGHALIRAIQVEAPEGLPSRIVLRQSTPRFQSPKPALAYAASVFLIIGALLAFAILPRTESVDQLVLQHILAEPEHLLATERISGGQVARVLASVGVMLQGDLGEVRFAERCPDWPGAHLVLAGRKGPVTVMIMPTQRVGAARALEHRALKGVLIPVQEGSLAIIGLPGEPLDEHEQRVRSAI